MTVSKTKAFDERIDGRDDNEGQHGRRRHAVSLPMNSEAGVEHIKQMSSEELSETLREMSRAVRQITDACRTEPARELVEFVKVAKLFSTEARRDRPGLADPLREVERALLSAEHRLEALRRAATRSAPMATMTDIARSVPTPAQLHAAFRRARARR